MCAVVVSVLSMPTDQGADDADLADLHLLWLLDEQRLHLLEG